MSSYSQAGEFERIQFPEGFITELVCARYGTLDTDFKDGRRLSSGPGLRLWLRLKKTAEDWADVTDQTREDLLQGEQLGRAGMDTFRALSRQGGAGDQ